MKPNMYFVEIVIFSLYEYHVTVRPTKIIKGANKIWAHLSFLENKSTCFKNHKFQKKSLIKVKLLSVIFLNEKIIEKDSFDFQH